MDIVFATFTLQGGGAERVILTLAKAYLELGHRVHIIRFKEQMDYSVDKRIQLHYVNYQKWRWLPKCLRNRFFAKVVDKYIRKNIPSVSMIISNLLPVDQVMHFSCYHQIIYLLHNTISQEYDLTQTNIAHNLKKTYENHSVVAVSKGVMADYLEHIQQRSDIQAIYNPIDQTQIRILSEAFVPEYKDYIVCVGSFKPAKNHELLINAYSKSSQKYPLLLLGKGEALEARKAQVAKLGLENRVIFLGFNKNPYPYIKNAKAMVLSSIFEGFGLVIAEALSLDVPVISTDCPSGPNELLLPHCLVEMNNPALLADKLNQVMDEPGKFHSPFNSELLPENTAKKYLAFKEKFIPND